MPRRKPMSKGPWDDPISPLQAARFAKRQTRQEIVDLVHLVCPGKGGEECRLDTDKLGEYERGGRRPGIEHVTALCRVFNKSPEELGLIEWRDQPPGATGATEEEAAEAGTASFESASGQPGGSRHEHDRKGDGEDAAAANSTNQTIIRYPERDVASQLLTHSGDGLALPIGAPDQPAPAGRELEVSTAVQRIQFIKTVGAVAGAALTDPIIAAAQHAHDAITLTKVSTAEIDRLTEAAYHHARIYYQLADPARADALLLDWATAGRLVSLQATQRQRRDLFDAYARLCGILGFLSFDRGDVARARVLLETGQVAATEAGDGDLRAWLIDRSCLIVEHAEQDPPRMLSVAGRGLDAIGNKATLVSARLLSRMACAHATLGDRPAALASLDLAEAALAAASGGCWPFERDTPRGFVFAPDLLAIDTGEVRLRLGDLAAARAACEHAAALLDEALGPNAARDSSAVPHCQLNLAMALAGMGELEGACEIATSAVTRYEGVAATFVMRRARRFERSMAATHQASPHSRNFSELLRDKERTLRSEITSRG